MYVALHFPATTTIFPSDPLLFYNIDTLIRAAPYLVMSAAILGMQGAIHLRLPTQATRIHSTPLHPQLCISGLGFVAHN